MTLTLRVGAWDDSGHTNGSPQTPFVEGYVERGLTAGSDPFDADNEANALRAAAQMVSELFARARAKRAAP